MDSFLWFKLVHTEVKTQGDASFILYPLTFGLTLRQQVFEA
jgi:hypothetical protein